jgi:hypothetical protein
MRCNDEREIALPESHPTPSLISAELSCVLLWALTGAFATGALALGLGAVPAVYLSDR